MTIAVDWDVKNQTKKTHKQMQKKDIQLSISSAELWKSFSLAPDYIIFLSKICFNDILISMNPG